jgi:hypothetical protein
MHKINFTVGDWSKDGHNQSDEYVVESNLKAGEIKRAYRVGSRKVGFDLNKDVAADYEDHIMNEEFYNRLIELIPEAEQHFTADNERYFEDGPTSYLKVYFEIVKLGNPEFVYTILNDKNPTINLGGYGLYN